MLTCAKLAEVSVTGEWLSSFVPTVQRQLLSDYQTKLTDFDENTLAIKQV